MISAATARSQNAALLGSISTTPIALFVGGTSGIGRSAAEAFAKHTNGNCQIIICGRNRSAANALIATFPPQPTGVVPHRFVECDCSLLTEVEAVTRTLVAELPKLNYVIISSGVLPLHARENTVEGLDPVLVLAYYARWKFIHDLLPAIKKATEKGEATGVLNIYAAGNGGAIDLNDLGLKKTYSLTSYGRDFPTYNDLALEVRLHLYK